MAKTRSKGEAHAYTPGLKVKKSMVVSKIRRLPIPGEVLVKEGDKVDFNTVVARTSVLGDAYFVPANTLLNIEPKSLPGCMVKKEGDEVKKDEVVAKYVTMFGMIKRFAKSPVDGSVEHVSDVTGRIVIRQKPSPIEVRAYIPGTVAKVLPREGAVIETNAAFIQGIFGVGGERHGELVILAKSPDEILKPEMITPECKGKILVGGSLITREVLEKAVEVEATAIMCGSIRNKDLTDFLGYEIGVAITGEEEIKLSLVIIEGFGKMAMSKKTFNLLKSFEGKQACICGATQIRAGVLRPEIIIPYEESIKKINAEDDELAGGIRSGTSIRVIRAPYFGQIGTVVSLPTGLEKLPTESFARVVEIELEDGKRTVVPRANIEIIEE